MRILLIMDPGIPVPPSHYGGHERLVYMFAEEFTKLGHDVTLLAGPDSHCSGKTYSFGKNKLQKSSIQKTNELVWVWSFLLKNKNNFDVIHNFGRLLYLLPILNYSVKKVMTYGRPVTQKLIRLINKLPNKNLLFTACSNDCVSGGNIAGKWVTVYNAIDFSKYKLNPSIDKDAPLIFLGRIEEVKGTHTAVKVALATQNKLLIAGNIEPEHQAFFDEQIKPHIDNKQITYLGPLNDQEKNHYLGKSKALLFPIEWDEPFGMVMVEAMACGTPAIGFKRGAVPEVIDEGVTGFSVINEAEIINCLPKIDLISRSLCREHAKGRFEVKVIANDYLKLFSNAS